VKRSAVCSVKRMLQAPLAAKVSGAFLLPNGGCCVGLAANGPREAKSRQRSRPVLRAASCDQDARLGASLGRGATRKPCAVRLSPWRAKAGGARALLGDGLEGPPPRSPIAAKAGGCAAAVPDAPRLHTSQQQSPLLDQVRGDVGETDTRGCGGPHLPWESPAPGPVSFFMTRLRTKPYPTVACPAPGLLAGPSR
jgi:hypothetical protein